jgi:hypothetical protein
VNRFEMLKPYIEPLERIPAAWLAIASALAVVGLSAFAYGPLFGEGMILTGDNLHAWRLSEMTNCIDDGQIPCRWAAELGNGYGLPLFNFYPPLPYYAGDLLHRLGLSYLNTVEALFAIALIVAGLSMFLLGRAMWGALGGVVSATAYVYAPYLALDAYMRGALGELWALAIAPALFWAVFQLVTTSHARYTFAIALFSALLLLSHSLTAMIVLPIVAIWAGALLLTRGHDAFRPALLGLSGAIWGLGLAAFFTLPMLAEGGDVQLDNLAAFPFEYQAHFTSVGDLFLERSSDYGFLLEGAGGSGTPIQIGWFHWALTALSLPAGLLLLRSGQRTLAIAVALLASFFAAGTFMAISASESVYEAFDPLRFLQFPWRYVGLISIAAAALAGVWLAVLRDRAMWLQLAVAGLLVGLFIGSGVTFFDPLHRCTVEADRPIPCPGSDEEYFSDSPYRASEEGSIRDYLPEAVDVIPERSATPAGVVSGTASITRAVANSESLEFGVEARSAATLEASVFDYPTWTVRIDDETVDHAASDPHGLITFDVPEGEHDIELSLGSTGIARLSNWISLVSWLALLIAVPARLVWMRTSARQRPASEEA